MSKTFTLIVCFLFLSNLLWGQKIRNKIVTQFNYTQIDSLITAGTKGLSNDDSSFIVINTLFFVGSYHDGDLDYAMHKNHFEIYFLFYKKGKLFVQKIDNYSFFKKLRIRNHRIKHFLEHSFNTMKKETLTYNVDTIYTPKDTILVTKITDHGLVRIVKIINTTDTLQYEFPNEYFANSNNLKTHKYKFFNYIDKAITQFEKKKPHRENTTTCTTYFR